MSSIKCLENFSKFILVYPRNILVIPRNIIPELLFPLKQKFCVNYFIRIFQGHLTHLSNRDWMQIKLKEWTELDLFIMLLKHLFSKFRSLFHFSNSNMDMLYNLVLICSDYQYYFKIPYTEIITCRAHNCLLVWLVWQHSGCLFCGLV